MCLTAEAAADRYHQGHTHRHTKLNTREPPLKQRSVHLFMCTSGRLTDCAKAGDARRQKVQPLKNVTLQNGLNKKFCSGKTQFLFCFDFPNYNSDQFISQFYATILLFAECNNLSFSTQTLNSRTPCSRGVKDLNQMGS